MKRLAIVLAVTLLGLLLAAALGRPHLLEWARTRLAAELGRAVHMPVSIAAMDVSFFPPAAELSDLVIGEPAALSLERGGARLLPLRSLAAGRPVVVVHGDGLTLDAGRFPPDSAAPAPAQGGGADLLPLDLEEISLSDLQVRVPITEDALEVTVPGITARVVAGGDPAELYIEVEIPGLDVRRRERRLHLERLYAEASLDQGGLRLNLAEIEGRDLHGSLGRAARGGSQPLSLHVPLEQLGLFDDALDAVEGRGRFAGSLQGDLWQARIDGTLEIERVGFFGRELGDLRSRIQGTGSTLQFSELEWSDDLGHVSGAGVLSFENAPSVDAELRWQEVQVDGLLATFGVRLDLENEVDADTRVQGTVAPLDLQVAGSGLLRPLARGAMGASSNLEAVARVQGDSGEVRAELRQGDRNRVWSELAWEGEVLRGRIGARAADLRLLSGAAPSFVRDLSPQGELSLALEITQVDGERRIEGTTQASNLEIAGLPAAQLRGTYSVTGDELELHELDIEIERGAGRATGTVALTGEVMNDWHAEVRGVETDLLARAARNFGVANLPVRGGRLSGTAHGQGTWGGLHLQAQLHAEHCDVAGEPFASLRIDLDSDLPRWAAKIDAVHSDDEAVAVRATSADGSRFSISVTSTALALQHVRLLDGYGVEGSLKVAGELTGALDTLGGSVEVDLSDLSVGGENLGDMAVRGTGAGGAWQVSGAALDDSLNIEGRVDLREGAGYDVLARWEEAGFAAPWLEVPVQVRSSGELRLNGRLDDVVRPSGRARVEHLEISRGTEWIRAAAPVDVEITAGRLQVSPFPLEVPGGQATVSGDFVPPAEMRVDVQGDVGLAVLELVVPAVSAARGHVGLRAHIAHRSDDGWELHGDVSIRDAVVDIGLPTALADGNADLHFDGARIEIEAASAAVGSGRVGLAGSIDVERGPRLSWTMEEVAVSPERGIEARLSGAGEVNGTWDQVEIGGHVNVLEALYDRNVEMTDVLPALVRRLRPAAPDEEPVVVVLLDLRVHAPDRVYIDNNLAQIELRADLRLRGEARQPSMTGSLRLLSGELVLRGNTFTVLAGTIDFRDRFKLNPVLEVTAEAEIDSGEDVYTITMRVTGTGEEPRVEFSADDPNLSQNDVISLVAFGKTMAQLQRSAGGTAAADVLAFVPTGSTEENVRELIGVDRFEVGASQASDSNAIEPMVTIGKNLGERLRGFVTTTFGVEQRRIVQLEYRWSRRVSVVGSWESETESQAGAFGGDVRFRYEFRRLPFSLFGRDDEVAATGDAE